MRLKSTCRCPKLRELGNGRGLNAHVQRLRNDAIFIDSAHAHSVPYVPYLQCVPRARDEN